MAKVCFDDEHIMVVRINSGATVPGSYFVEGEVLARDCSDEELVAAVRRAWDYETSRVRADVSVEERDASWQPICDLFGVDFYDRVPNVNANAVRGWLTFTGSRWKKYRGHRERIADGKSRFRIEEGSDSRIAEALREAMAATKT